MKGGTKLARSSSSSFATITPFQPDRQSGAGLDRRRDGGRVPRLPPRRWTGIGSRYGRRGGSEPPRQSGRQRGRGRHWDCERSPHVGTSVGLAERAPRCLPQVQKQARGGRSLQSASSRGSVGRDVAPPRCRLRFPGSRRRAESKRHCNSSAEGTFFVRTSDF
jgi:hypothetical protein